MLRFIGVVLSTSGRKHLAQKIKIGQMLQTSQKINKADRVLTKKSAAKKAEVLRLCRTANYADALKVGMYLRTKAFSKQCSRVDAARCGTQQTSL